jgi:hypothetical protein
MVKFVFALALLLVAADASAQERHEIGGMSCAEVQTILKDEGRAILRYRSSFNLSLPLYDLYVSGQKQCGNEEVAVRKGVPTTDRDYCPVYRCVESKIFVAR